MPQNDRPRLRPVEAFPSQEDGRQVILVHDPTGMAAGTLMLAGPAVLIVSLMDGLHTREEIREAYEAQIGEALGADELDGMIEQLDAAHYLDSPRFAEHLESLVRAYRESPARVSAPQAYGPDGEGPAEVIGRMLSSCRASSSGAPGRRLVGLVAPHLDYPRGTPCYADAYGILAAYPAPRRVVILGTNHFGRATSVVGTRKDFQTPLGTTRVDRRFLEALEARCGLDLCEHEFDHQREHSVELQVLILQQMYGAENFTIVPFLCHDPCGPNGTAPYDGKGVDLRDFAEALGELTRSDSEPTLIIAGADLSHVGRRFGDDRDLDAPFLEQVARRDHDALAEVLNARPAVFVQTLAARENDTRVCSAGCIYALTTALPSARPELLRYHQAVDADSGTCVTCTAMAFWEE